MVNMLGYINGTLRIKVTGKSPERFINLCSRNDILLWNIVQVYDVFYMNINLKSFYHIKPLLRKTGTKVIILERYGLPFFMMKIRRRKAFLIGLLLCLLFWYGSGLFIWRIEFQGNYTVTEDMLEQALEEQGIYIGRLKLLVDLQEANSIVRENFEDVTWVGMGFHGTTLQVNIKEKLPESEDSDIIIQDYDSRVQITPDMDSSGGGNILAREDGRILSIIVRSGIPKVKKGDTVTKDQILVEGLVPIQNEDGTVKEYMNVQPDADILMERYLYESFTLPFTYVEKNYTGRFKKQYYLFWNERKLELPGSVPYLQFDEVTQLKYVSMELGEQQKLGYGIRLVREFQNWEYEYTLEEAESLLNQQLEEYIQSLSEKGVHIIEKNGKIDTSTGQWKLDVELLVQEYVNNR